MIDLGQSFQAAVARASARRACRGPGRPAPARLALGWNEKLIAEAHWVLCAALLAADGGVRWTFDG
jgi:hypothetical protein